MKPIIRTALGLLALALFFSVPASAMGPVDGEVWGYLAVRGGIVDLFPPQRSHPVRIELIGDEVESIRDFDPASQRSQAPLAYVVAPPPRELLIDRSRVIERSEEIRGLAAEQKIEPRDVDEFMDSLLRGNVPPGAEALAPLLLRSMETVLDFLPDEATEQRLGLVVRPLRNPVPDRTIAGVWRRTQRPGNTLYGSCWPPVRTRPSWAGANTHSTSEGNQDHDRRSRALCEATAEFWPERPVVPTKRGRYRAGVQHLHADL